MDVNPDDVKNLTVVQVEEYLQVKGFGENITNVLRGNEIDGESLLLLNDVDVASMGFKIGPAAKFRSFLDTLKVVQNRSPQSEKQKQSGSVANGNESCRGSIDMHLPQSSQTDEVSVMDVLQEHCDGRRIIVDYLARNEEFITSDERITIVQILCEHFVKTDAFKYFPSTSTKHLWAEALVKSFPCLGTKVTDAQGKITMNHDIYFHPKAGGFIENKLKEMRRSKGIRKREKNKTPDAPNEKKARKKPKNGEIHISGGTVMIDESMMVSMVSWLKVHGPSASNKTKIHDYMEKTFNFREKQISEQFTCASQVFEEYPRYVDFDNGSLILHDFHRKYKGVHSSLETRFFQRFQSSLLGLAERTKVDVLKTTDGLTQ